MNSYEGVFILDESLKDDAVDDALGGIRKEIESMGGAVASVTRLGRRPFARPQKKRKSGLFVVITFEADSDKIAPLHARLKMKDDIFRAQIVRAERSDESRDTEPERAEAAGEKE